MVRILINITRPMDGPIHVYQWRAGYIRVSTDSQAEEGYSLEAQEERLQAYAKAEGWPPLKLYIDPAYSGSNLNRPAMQELIKDIQDGHVMTVVVFKLDRLSRSQRDTLYFIEDILLPNNVGFISMTERLDTTSPYGRAMIGILSAFGQMERENIYIRTRMGMKERVKKGYWRGGGGVPFGYDYDKEQGILVPNPDEAPIVQKIYDMYLEGFSPLRIARITGLKYDKLITQILTRKSNTGCITYKGEEFPGKHEPIISLETYEKAMAVMEQRRKDKTTAKAPKHLLSGVCYCQNCGKKMRYIKWGDEFKIVCYSIDKHKNPRSSEEYAKCSATKKWAKEVESAVLKPLLDNLQVRTEVISQALNEASGSDIRDLMGVRIDKLVEKLKVLYNRYAELSVEDSAKASALESTIQENEEELDLLQAEYEKEIREANQVFDHFVEDADSCELKTIWEYLNPTQRNVIIKSCIEKISIGADTINVFYRLKNFVPPKN